MRTGLRKFLGNRDGAAIIEFAIVAPVFFLLLLGIIEFGLIMFSSVALESIVMMASRTASLGLTSDTNFPGCKTTNTSEFVQCYVQQKAKNLINGKNITVIATPYKNGAPSAPTPPDVCISDMKSDQCGTCKQYMEVNGISGYQCASDPKVTQSNAGGSGQLVQLTAYYPWKINIPFLAKYFGCHGKASASCQPGVMMLTSSTIVKNEPY